MYSRPRVTQMGDTMGLMQGMALDLTTSDENGKPWDFSQKEMRDKASRLVDNKTALLVIGSPMCAAFSQVQKLNANKINVSDRQDMIHKGRQHLKVCLELYQAQIDNGLYFLHEHPASASSWKLPESQTAQSSECQ